MQINESLRMFLGEHANDDVNELILNSLRYKNIDVKFVAEQISARKIIKDKLTSWHENGDLIFPSALSAEQCSSELTALYKQRLVNKEDIVCDMTGGLGVDAYYFSQKAHKVIYIERNTEYCKAAINNFQSLNAANIEVLNKDSIQIFQLHSLYSFPPEISIQNPVLYIDPSRRGNGNKRLYALKDCEPDLTEIWSDLQQIG
ncbi:MAG: SAM-dependent methyltransferase, partial [Tannerella sp.]|nr:SAM-dependent methyltransferase [Tannerella sp.]